MINPTTAPRGRSRVVNLLIIATVVLVVVIILVLIFPPSRFTDSGDTNATTNAVTIVPTTIVQPVPTPHRLHHGLHGLTLPTEVRPDHLGVIRQPPLVDHRGGCLVTARFDSEDDHGLTP